MQDVAILTVLKNVMNDNIALNVCLPRKGLREPLLRGGAGSCGMRDECAVGEDLCMAPCFNNQFLKNMHTACLDH